MLMLRGHIVSSGIVTHPVKEVVANTCVIKPVVDVEQLGN